MDALETDNLLRQATVSIASALARTESAARIGARIIRRRDDANWLKHSLGFVDDDGNVQLSTRPVRMEAEEPNTGARIEFLPEE